MLLLLSSVALAAQVEVLPMGPVIADGETPVTVRLLIPGLQATDRVKLKPYTGSSVTPTIESGGVVAVQFTPHRSGNASNGNIEVSVRGSMKLDEKVEFPLVPRPEGSLELGFEPEVFQVGATGSVTITVTAKGGHPLPEEARSVLLSSSAGKVTGIKDAGDGVWTATWTAPKGLSEPQHVLFTAIDATTPNDTRGLAGLPILVTQKKKLPAPAGSQNVLVIGDNQIGPLTAAADGTIAVTAVFDPRVTEGTLQSVDTTGSRTDSRLDLKVSPAPTLAFGPLPSKVPANTAVTIGVALLEPDGSPWKGAAPKLAKAGEARSQGDGWFTFQVTAPGDKGAWVLDASAGDLEASTSLKVVDAPPSVTLSSDPATLPEGSGAFKVTAALKDARGSAITGKAPRFTAEGAIASGSPRDNGDGTYTQAFKTKQDEVKVSVRPRIDPTGLPPARLIAFPRSPAVVNDGTTTMEIVVIALDGLGLPVPGVALQISAPVGDGAVAPDATTDQDGIALISYRAGTSEGPAAITATSGGLSTSTLFYQGAGRTDPAGSERDLGDARSWNGTMPGITVGRTPPAPVVAAAAPVTAAPGETGTPAAATPAVSTGDGGSAREPRSAASGASGKPIHLRLYGMDMGYRVRQLGSGEEPLPETGFNQALPGGVPGVQLGGDIWFGGGAFGLDGRVKLGGYRTTVAGETNFDPIYPAMVGLRYRQEINAPLSWFVWAGGHAVDVPTFVYTDAAKTGATQGSAMLLGGRLGGGLFVETDKALVRLEIAETITPLPGITHAGVAVDVPLGLAPKVLDVGDDWPGFLSVGTDFDLHHARTELEGETIKVRGYQWALLLGGGAAF